RSCEKSHRLPGFQAQSSESGGHFVEETSMNRSKRFHLYADVLAIFAAVGVHNANAAPGQMVGFLSTLGGSVSPISSFNSSGGSNTVTILGTGLFKVTFPGLGNGLNSNAQVNAYNTNGHPHICTSQGWGSNGTDVTAYVGCFDFSGHPYSADFSIFYQSRNAAPGGWLGFLGAVQPSPPSATPRLSAHCNVVVAANTISRSDTDL